MTSKPPTFLFSPSFLFTYIRQSENCFRLFDKINLNLCGDKSQFLPLFRVLLRLLSTYFLPSQNTIISKVECSIKYIPDFGNFGSSFANNAAYQLIGNRHFVGLLRGLRPILMACKSGQSCKRRKIIIATTKSLVFFRFLSCNTKPQLIWLLL